MMLSKYFTDTPSDVPSLQPNSYPTLEEFETPSMLLYNDQSNSESNFLTRKPTVYPLNLSSFMPSHFRSIELNEVHGSSPSLISFFNPSKFPYLTPSEDHSDILIELYSSLCTLGTSMLPSVVPSASHSDTPSDAPSSQPIYSTILEKSAAPSILLSDRPSFSSSDIPSIMPL